MKKVIIVIIILILCMVFAAIGYFIGFVSYRFRNMRQEYATANQIRALVEYVEIKKDWPHSIADLPGLDQNLTNIDFGINIFTSDRYDIMNSVDTNSGRWFTYPHYKSDMDGLYRVISRIRESKSN